MYQESLNKLKANTDQFPSCFAQPFYSAEMSMSEQIFDKSKIKAVRKIIRKHLWSLNPVTNDLIFRLYNDADPGAYMNDIEHIISMYKKAAKEHKVIFAFESPSVYLMLCDFYDRFGMGDMANRLDLYFKNYKVVESTYTVFISQYAHMVAYELTLINKDASLLLDTYNATYQKLIGAKENDDNELRRLAWYISMSTFDRVSIENYLAVKDAGKKYKMKFELAMSLGIMMLEGNIWDNIDSLFEANAICSASKKAKLFPRKLEFLGYENALAVLMIEKGYRADRLFVHELIEAEIKMIQDAANSVT